MLAIVSAFRLVSEKADQAHTRYSYDAYGTRTAETEETATPWGFTGTRVDQTGIGYHRHRYFDSSSGRWLSKDPAGRIDTDNLYVYARNAPTVGVDPLGLLTLVFHGDAFPVDVFKAPEKTKENYVTTVGVNIQAYQQVLVVLLTLKGMIDPSEKHVEFIPIVNADEITQAISMRTGTIAADRTFRAVYLGHSGLKGAVLRPLLYHPGQVITGTAFGQAVLEGLGGRGKRLLQSAGIAACETNEGGFAEDAAAALKKPVQALHGIGFFQATQAFVPNGQGPAFTHWTFNGDVRWTGR